MLSRLRWFISRRVLGPPKKWLGAQLRRRGLVLLMYRGPEREATMRLVSRVKNEVRMELSAVEAYQLVSAVARSAKARGDCAEVGVFRGGSARLICEVKGDRPLHLFDTFSGLPGIDALDADHFYAGQFSGSLAAVQHYLRGFDDVHYYPGLFPGTAAPLSEHHFSFVHLDVDIFQSTWDALAFFYPRMSPGGIILSHDYSYAAGVRKAFDDFFADKPEPVLELAGSQCLVVKLGEG